MKLLLASSLCWAVAVCLYGQQKSGPQEVELKAEAGRLETLGGEYLKAGRLSDAEPLMERAVAMATEGNGFSNTERAAAHIARGDLYHAMAQLEGSTPSWNDLAGLDYWQAAELLKSSPDPLPAADAMIRWASTMAVPADPAPGNLIPPFLGALLTTALEEVEKANGNSGSGVELAKRQLVWIGQAMKRRDEVDRLCPATLVNGNQVGLLTECASAALNAGKLATAESFGKRADALIAVEPGASFGRDRVRTKLVLAESALKQGRLDEARTSADQAVALSGQYLGMHHQLRHDSFKIQAKVLDQLKMKAESKQALKEGEDIEAAIKTHTTNPRLVRPRLVVNEKPIYPPEAKTAHVDGRVFILCEIGVDGKARELALLNHLGYGLDDSAIAAIRHWKFDPMKKDGQPVASAGMIEVNFKLK